MPLPSCGSGGVGVPSNSINIAAPSSPSDTCSPRKNLKLNAMPVFTILLPILTIIVAIEFVFMAWGIPSGPASIGNPSTILGSLKKIMPLTTPLAK